MLWGHFWLFFISQQFTPVVEECFVVVVVLCFMWLTVKLSVYFGQQRWIRPDGEDNWLEREEVAGFNPGLTLIYNTVRVCVHVCINKSKQNLPKSTKSKTKTTELNQTNKYKKTTTIKTICWVSWISKHLIALFLFFPQIILIRLKQRIFFFFLPKLGMEQLPCPKLETKVEEADNFTKTDPNQIVQWPTETALNFKVVGSRPVMGPPVF